MLTAFLLYLTLFFGPVQQLSQVFDGYQQARVGLNRISELLRTPPRSRTSRSGRCRCRRGCAARSSSTT